MSEAATIVDWTKFSRMRFELGANFVRILGYFREDGEKSVGRDRGCDAPPGCGRDRPARPYDEGRGPPVRRRAARGSGRADRDSPAAARSNRTSSPTTYCPRSPSCGRSISETIDACSRRRPIRSPSAAAGLRQEAEQPGIRAALAPRHSSAASSSLRARISSRWNDCALPLRICCSPPRQAAPGPFERTVIEPVEPGLRPEQHQHPHRHDRDPELDAAEMRRTGRSPSRRRGGHQERRAEIVGEGGAPGRGDPSVSGPPARVSRITSAAVATIIGGRVSTGAAMLKRDQHRHRRNGRGGSARRTSHRPGCRCRSRSRRCADRPGRTRRRLRKPDLSAGHAEQHVGERLARRTARARSAARCHSARQLRGDDPGQEPRKRGEDLREPGRRVEADPVLRLRPMGERRGARAGRGARSPPAGTGRA